MNTNNEDGLNLQNENPFENLDPMQVLIALNESANKLMIFHTDNIEMFQKTYSIFNEMIKVGRAFVVEGEEIEKRTIEIKKNISEYGQNVFDKIKDLKVGLDEDSLIKINEIKINIEILMNITEFFRKLKYWIIGGFCILVIVIAFQSFLMHSWYNTSIKTKLELRKEILAELKNSEKGIYDQSYVSELEENTKMINSWLLKFKKTKEGENFILYKDGYEAKKGNK